MVDWEENQAGEEFDKVCNVQMPVTRRQNFDCPPANESHK